MSERPGKGIARRPLHLVWLADVSASMGADGKIEALNNAIRETIPHLKTVARQNPHASLLVRALAFGSDVRWHIEDPVPADELAWDDLEAEDPRRMLDRGGVPGTAMGAALAEAATVMRVPPMENRAFPPAVVVISDGQATDAFDDGLRVLMDEPWGKRAVRLAVGIGRDADLDHLQRFIGNRELAPVSAHNPEQLTRMLRWASTSVVRLASQPTQGGVPVPTSPTGRSIDETW